VVISCPFKGFLWPHHQGRRFMLYILMMSFYCQGGVYLEITVIFTAINFRISLWQFRNMCSTVDKMLLNLTFIGTWIANIFAEYNQQDTKFLGLFIPVRWSTCFRRVFRPSSGAQNCTYSVRHLSDQYCYLLLKQVERLTEISWEISHLGGWTLRKFCCSVP